MLIGISKGERRGRGEERKRKHTHKEPAYQNQDGTCHN